MEPPLRASGGAEVLKNISPGSSISVAYHPLFGPHDDLIFLELDEKLLPDLLHERYVVINIQLFVTLSLPSPSPTFNMVSVLF